MDSAKGAGLIRAATMIIIVALLLSNLSVAAVPPKAPTGELDVQVEQLRNARGVIHACLTRDPRNFPDCSHDPTALKRTVPAGTPSLRFTGVAPGRYALTVVHDENSNNRFDKTFGIPREGFGFSRNPVVKTRAPRFGDVAIDIAPGVARQTIRLQYVL